MVKVCLSVLVVILFLILLSSEVYAINLGSIVKNKFTEISKDESAKFKMLFWNVESKSYIVKLTVKEAPKDWIVLFDPSKFVLDKTIGEEYINLPYTDENIKAKIVNVFVKPVSKARSGKYFVVVKAETKLSQNEKNGITFVPQRLFEFEVDIKGFNTTESAESINIEFSENKVDTDNENLKVINLENENNISRTYFYLAIIFLVLVMATIIYKK
jgi:hypothetical protein